MDIEPIKVLMVEDTPDYAWMLKTILSHSNSDQFEVLHVENLETAQQLACSYDFDIILLDLTLPDSKGFGTFDAIYTIAPHIPIVVMTAIKDKALALRAVREGAQDFLEKGDLEANHLIRAMQFAIERHRGLENMRRMSFVDELTGLLNRRGFHSLALQHIKIAQRSDRELILFFADLDGLKQINDNFGHTEGDRALKTIASIMKSTLRSSDLIARFGGDEFTILAIDAPQHNIENILARLRYQLEKSNQSNQHYQLALSIGVAKFDPQKSAKDIDKMLAQADRALYEEKRKKNRILLN